MFLETFVNSQDSYRALFFKLPRIQMLRHASAIIIFIIIIIRGLSVHCAWEHEVRQALLPAGN